MAASAEEDEELQMALKMSLQASELPEPKRSRPPPPLSPEDERRAQRELMASAAERRIRAAASSSSSSSSSSRPSVVGASATAAVVQNPEPANANQDVKQGNVEIEELQMEEVEFGEELSLSMADELFAVVFGREVTKDVLSQWSNQGIRFSSDPETNMGLVQHEGGPCGVLATIQAYVLKYLLFFLDDLRNEELTDPWYALEEKRFYQSSSRTTGNFASFTDDKKTSALVHGMVEILFLCGSGKRVTITSIVGFNPDAKRRKGNHDKVFSEVLEGLCIESANDLHKVLRVKQFASRRDAFSCLVSIMPVLQSRMGAMLFLISALLSRGLENIQSDRDDPSQPLVTAPFGHASQEIVNLLLCGEAIQHVFDGRMDLGEGMFLKGLKKDVEVGFLTLLEALNLCKVGQYLKSPKWPIWVVGSESHYTVLFALDPAVQEENELELRESKIRREFDAQDQSGGGGFISTEGFHEVLREADINFPPHKVESLCSSGFIVWSEFWQALLELDKSFGGMKDPSGLMGKKQFDIYHFNGIAKSDLNGSLSPGAGDATPVQRPRLCKLSVVVPPRWSQDEYLADVLTASSSKSNDEVVSLAQPPQISQHVPLIDCIRTRWPRAVCSWVGDAPSIV